MAAARSEDVRQSGYQLGGAVRRHWVLFLTEGIVAGVLLIGLPGTALWALGLLLGINLIFGGWALIFMALHARPTSAAAAA